MRPDKSDKQLFEDSSKLVLLEGTRRDVRNGGNSGFDNLLWLKSIGCTQGILPYNLEEYAFCKARWLECEDMNTKHGLLVKDQNGKPMPSPFVGMAQQYLKQTNEVWSKIYIVVRESKLSKWDETNPNDDIMEKLLGGKA